MTTADVIVIGGGIAGISAAAEIARTARVVVLESEPVIGYHATGRSAALFIRNYGNATLRKLNVLAGPALDALADLAGGAVLRRRGALTLAYPGEEAAFAAYCAGATGLDRLTGAEAAGIVPILRGEAIVEAAFEPDAQDIDVDRVLQGYARALRTRGGSVMTGAAVTAITRDGTWRVETGSGSFAAPVIVNAAGAWADEVAARAGAARLGLVPHRRSAALLPAPGDHALEGWPLFGSASETWYAKPDAGKLMVSPADEDPVEPHDAWPDDMVLAEGLDRYERAVTVPVTRVERTWAGLRSFVPDRSPVVGFAPEAEGFFWLAGQGGYGVQTAPALARITADLVTGHGDRIDPALRRAIAPDRITTEEQT